MPKMVIANALRDGLVVFLAENRAWVHAIADGAIAHDSDRAERLLAIAQQAELRNEVIGPELIEVELKDGQRHPVHIREAIRATGPIVQGHPGENDRRYGT